MGTELNKINKAFAKLKDEEKDNQDFLLAMWVDWSVADYWFMRGWESKRYEEFDEEE